MAHLPEESKFDEGVYQLEMTDPVVGGPNGISNSPLRNLANRTRWLKDQLTAALTGKADKESPQLTGEPTTTEPGENDNSTRIASTGWARSLVTRLAAPIAHVGSRGAAHGEATTSEAGFMSAADKAKLNGIAAGAQGNTVTSVAGKTGAVTLAVADVSGALASSHAGTGGTAHALATSSQAGFMSAADKAKLDTVSAGAGSSGVTSVAGRTGAVTLSASDVSGVLTDSHTNSVSAHPTATAWRHGFMSSTDKAKLDGLSASSGVTSVAGRTGAVTLRVADVSGAASTSNPTFSGTVRVANNTSVDLNEPGSSVYVPTKTIMASSTTEAASMGAVFAYAAPKHSPGLTGSPTAPTPSNTDNSTRLATTAWVRNALATLADTMGMTVRDDPNFGYARLPSWLWGLTFVWVKVETANRGHMRGTWPIAFPRHCFMTVGAPRFGSLHAPIAVNGDNQQYFYEAPGNNSGNNIGFNILAIGR
ncbi:MAG: hypothetical protein Q4D91_01060 [Lautropia sp.]|nr:hypothetical protein [Lautropia sp.]